MRGEATTPNLSVLILHGIGFHEPGSGAAGVRRALATLGVACPPVEEVVWVNDADAEANRSSFLGRARIFSHLVRLAVIEISNPALGLSPSARRLISSSAYTLIFAGLLTGALCIATWIAGALWGWIGFNTGVLVGFLALTLGAGILLILIDIAPFNTPTWMQKARALGLIAVMPFAYFIQLAPALAIIILPFIALIGIALPLGLMAFVEMAPVTVVRDGYLVPQTTDGWIIIPILLVGLVLVGPLMFLLSLWLRAYGGIVAASKYLADVALYLSNDRFGAKVRARLAAAVKAAPAASTLVICAHSLGSVIAFDVLRANAPHCRVVLVTGGSPLSRYLHRFFPALYPAPAEVERAFSASGRVRWFNIYRRADPVGGRLDLEPGLDVDLSGVNYQGRWRIEAHYNYWNDPTIAAAVRIALQSANTEQNAR